jgi:hypothetical protein
VSYFHCRRGDPCEDCNGYVGPLDDYSCHCTCHGRQRSECTCGHWREWSGVRGVTAERAQRLHDQVRPECGLTVTFEADFR